jgi:VanZ family protein
VISVGSTNLGSAANSDPLLLRLVHFLLRESQQSNAPGDFSDLSWAVRKTAHLVEYAVLALLASYMFRGILPRWTRAADRISWETLWRLAVVVLPFGWLMAAVDEFHQVFVASRTASGRDTLFDLLGLVLGLMIAWLVARKGAAKPGGAA